MTTREFEIPQQIGGSGAKIAMVLGSGLNNFVADLQTDFSVSYADLPGIPHSGVPGHAGRVSVMRISGEPVLIAQGRTHLYEGYSAHAVTAMVRLLHQAGVTNIVLTNAAGSLNPEFSPGNWMLIADHLNLTGSSPLTGGPNFVDLSQVYSQSLRSILQSTAKSLQIPLGEGVYAGLPGPQYETPAEIRMLRTLGADAVGMSTVLEAIQARALGLNVAAMSCITNWGAGIENTSLDHADVIKIGQKGSGTLSQILTKAIPEILLRNSHV